MAGYGAARQAVALHDQQNCARLRLGGRDRIDFLQRMTTNDLRLPPGRGTVTILTSPTARILAVLTVLVREEELLLLGGPDEGPRVYNALRSQVFFGDDVAVEGHGEALVQVGLYGPSASLVLDNVGCTGASSLALFSWAQFELDKTSVMVQRNEGLGSDGFTLLAPASANRDFTAQALQDALIDAGAIPLPEEAFHVLRVEAGIPSPGLELTDQVNPLEAGLRRFCDEHKGCYTGQEIIARQITYDKVIRHLVGLLPAQNIQAGSEVYDGGRKVGLVTSVAESVALHRPIALAFVRRPHHDPGTAVEIHSQGQITAATVAELPFTAQSLDWARP